jgi:hypothetical protein
MTIMSSNTKIPSRETLEASRERAMKFLSAVGTTRAIYAALATRGYTLKDHQEGWKLALKVSGYDREYLPEEIDNMVAEAIRDLDAWDEDGFRVARAALERLHPDQAAFVFNNLAAAQGVEAVASVAKFLDRLDALEDSPDRKKTRKEDRAALDTLGKRGIDAEERIRLRKLVKAAQGMVGLPVGDPMANEKEASNLDDLVALHRWYRDWAETARVAVPRRDLHIKLGIASRRAPSSGGDDETNNEPAGEEPKAPVS